MEDVVQGNGFGALIVFTAIAVTILVVMIANMRTGLRSVPQTAEILAQQFALAHNELVIHQAAIAEAEKALSALDRDLAQAQATLDERRQRLMDVRNRVPSEIYVLDQIMQQSHQPWLIPVWLEGATEEADGDWVHGRRYLVYGEDEENAARRIEVRYPPREGYRAAAPEPFTFI